MSSYLIEVDGGFHATIFCSAVDDGRFKQKFTLEIAGRIGVENPSDFLLEI